jgi:multiple antibiotic resistance protein
LRSSYDEWPILIGILINVIFVYLVLHSLDFISRILGHSGMLAIRKFFGVVLLAIAVKIFAANVGGLIK